MTREEAITYLKVIWNRYKAEYEIERETLDAYHMAIEALSGRRKDATEEDYAYCDDCQAVEMCMWYPYDGCQFKVSRPKGEWLDSGIGGAKVCSVCNAHMGLSSFNYCPSCGAYMRGKENE